MDYVSLSSLVHAVEQFQLSLPTANKVLIGAAAAIPVAILLHDTSDLWLPTRTNIPILSFFVRRWRTDP